MLFEEKTRGQFWSGIIETKDFFCNNSKKMIGNGLSTSFWCYMWSGETPLSVKFNRLFELSLNKEINFNSALNSGCNSLAFKRKLSRDGVKNLEDLKNICDSHCLSNSKDKTIWLLDKKGFSVKSMYNKCRSSLNKIPYWFIWKAKIPHRINVFLWLILKDMILSKENLKNRKWKGKLLLVWLLGIHKTHLPWVSGGHLHLESGPNGLKILNSTQ